MTMAEKSPVAQEIEAQIRAKGPIPFSEFMGLSLYGTQRTPGYYTGSVSIGGGAIGTDYDFTTSPETSYLFGHLIGKMFTNIRREVVGDSGEFNIYEMGAGNGTLAKDILYGIQMYHPRFSAIFRVMFGDYGRLDDFDRAVAECRKINPQFDPLLSQIPQIPGYLRGVNYHILETSPRLMEVQRQQLEELPVNLQHGSAIDSAKAFVGKPGVVVTNELVDAFPVELVTTRGGHLQQMFIANGDDKKFEVLWADPSTKVDNVVDQYKLELEPGMLLPLNINSLEWLENVSQGLPQGFVLTIDYGGSTRDVTSSKPVRRYVAAGKKLDIVNTSLFDKSLAGLTDVTADVNFELLIKAGESFGLKTVAYMTQKEFLEKLGVDYNDPFTWFYRNNIGHFGYSSSKLYDWTRHFDIYERLGSFKVLLQSKNAPTISDLYGPNFVRPFGG